MSQSTPTSAMQMPAQGSGYQIQATPTTLPMIPVSTPMQLKRQALERRPQVLAALFPDEGKPEGDDGEGPISRRSLKYDSTSKQYVFCEDPTEATSCSICMDTLVPEDDTVTGLCTHIYHRECIMNWLQGGHDECPNCRQPMWDPETYKMVDQQIMEQNSGRPSAPVNDVIAMT
ncbi:hypothetical protein MHU86_23523 [Fragilaria crotonensis]|nr:hypothetical protein MHU86_23523 [Fragilaria crotonensis]